jgi:carbon monoxide dehydrogenase subunit G
MFAVTTEIEIEATPEEAYRFLDDPRNHVKITPSLVSIDDVQWLENGGKRATYEYKLAGVQLTGEVRDRHRDPPTDLVQALSGAIDGTISYTFDGGDATTTVTYEAEYALPTTVIETVLAPVASSYNEREAEATLKNLKAHLEA